jgi:hypothetical protein
MTTTTNLDLPYIMPAQAQKHVTHNEALRALDAIVQLSVADRDLTEPPATPDEGERHIVASGAAAGWAGRDGQIAAFQDGAWAFYSPGEGWISWVADEDAALVFDGTGWVTFTGGDLNPAALVGINATADSTNRLAVKSDAVLMSHDDVTPGNGSLQLKLNKATAGDTASLLYQTGWSGRAEFGTAGDDDFHVKVSPDGLDWHEALIVDRTTGSVSMPATPPIANAFNILKDAGRFAGSPEPQGVIASSFTAPAYVQAANGATIAEGPKFIHNNTTYGGSAGTLDADIDALIQKLKDSEASNAYRRYGIEFFALEVTAGSGTSTARVIGGVTHYLPVGLPSVPIPTDMTINFHLLVKSGSVGLVHGSLGPNRLFVDGVLTTSSLRAVPEDGWKQVTRLIRNNPRQYTGYASIEHQLFATPESVFYLAAMTITPRPSADRAGALLRDRAEPGSVALARSMLRLTIRLAPGRNAA